MRPVVTYQMRVSIDGERDDVVAALEVNLDVTTRADDDVLLAVDGVGGWRRIDAGAREERPQNVAALRIVGAEPAIAFTGEHEATGSGQRATHHGQRRLFLPGNLAGVVVDGGDVAERLLGGDHLESAAKPELAARIGRALDLIGHRLMQVDGVGQAELRVDRHRRPFDAAIGAWQHAGTFSGRQRPHAFLRHHRLGEADEAAILAAVDEDVSDLVAVDDGGDDVSIRVLGIDQDRRAHGVEIPHVVRDELEVADIFAGVEIDRYQRLGIEIVAGPNGAVEVWRRVADHEEDTVGLEINRRILPHAAADRLVWVAGLGELRLLRLDIAMHVMAGSVVCRPHANGFLGGRVEVPDELAGLGVIGADEAADTVFAAVGADQDLAVDGGRRHGLAVAEGRIGNLGLPHDAAGLGTHRVQIGIERGEIDLVVINGDAAVVRSAAIG